MGYTVWLILQFQKSEIIQNKVPGWVSLYEISHLYHEIRIVTMKVLSKLDQKSFEFLGSVTNFFDFYLFFREKWIYFFFLLKFLVYHTI